MHGLGDGFEFATRDVAVQRRVEGGRLELRMLATGVFPQATVTLSRQGRPVGRSTLDLGPEKPAVATLADRPDLPVQVTITSREGHVLADFTTPLPIAKVEPPDPATFKERPEDQLSVEELYLKGRKADRATDRRGARQWYEKALARDAGHVASLRALAVLDFEAGRYAEAAARLQKALQRDSDEGLCWFYLGLCRLRQGDFGEARRAGYRAIRCPGTVSLGYDLVGRAEMRLGRPAEAAAAFQKAVHTNGEDRRAAEHLILALHAAGRATEAAALAARRVAACPTALVPRFARELALGNRAGLAEAAAQARRFLGEDDFEILEASLVWAELGRFDEAAQVVQAGCIDPVPPAERGFMPLYYLAWYAARQGDRQKAQAWLQQAAAAYREKVFASRPEEVDILRFAVEQNPADPLARLQLGCLLAHLGRVGEATPQWQQAAELAGRVPASAAQAASARKIAAVAWRNLGLAAAARDELSAAEQCYRKAIPCRPNDQTLYRDLAEILLAAGRRAEAIRLLETMPLESVRRAEITVMLAQAYMDEKRYDDCVKLLENTPYFVNWEGQDITWRLFNRAHIERGKQRMEKGDARGALSDFEAALTYPPNLNVGRSNKPQEAPAQYWRGKALAALGRLAEARAAWQAGANGADVPGVQNEYRQKCRQALADKAP